MDNDSIIKAYDDILKKLGVGREVGTEKTAQKFWMDFLRPFGFKPQQAFPDNMTLGTNRNSGDASIGRTTTVLNHLFEPKWVTHTYYDLDSGIPLYTRTEGETSGNLIIRGGLIGMKDVAGNRVPTDDPLKTTIDRKRATKMVRASELLDVDKKNDKGFASIPKPPKGWIDNHKTLDSQVNYLEDNFPEYNNYLVEYLHKPIEGEGILQELQVSKTQADFVAVVNDLIRRQYPGLVKEILDEARQMNKDKWHITVAANERLKSPLVNTGFKALTPEYMEELLSDKSGKVSDYIKTAIKRIKSKDGRLTGKNSEYFIRTPRGDPINPLSKSAWAKTLRGDNMFDKIKKGKTTHWFDLLKFKGRWDDKDDDDMALPAGGGPSKKPKNPEDDDTIRERQSPKRWKDDWKKDNNIDPITGKRRKASKLAEGRETVGTDTFCCGKIRQYLKDYVELTSFTDDYQLRMVEEWIDENITCSDIEKAMAVRISVIDRYGNVNNNPTIADLHNASRDEIKSDVGGDKGFTIPLEFDEDSGEVSGSKEIRIPANEMNFFNRVAGKLSFLPKEYWETKPDRPSRKIVNGRRVQVGGLGMTLAMAYHICIQNHVQSKLTEISDNLENEEFYADVGVSTDKQMKLKIDILDAFKQRGGKVGAGGSFNPADMQKYPDLWNRWQRASQISPDSGKGTGFQTENEMNSQDLARERLWDYIDEMRGNKVNQEERQRKRDANPLPRYPEPPKKKDEDEEEGNDDAQMV